MTGAPKNGPLGRYRELLHLSPTEDFVLAVLSFDPFAFLDKSYCDVSALGCAMLSRLLKKAQQKLAPEKSEASPGDALTDGWGDGWGDLDISVGLETTQIDTSVNSTGPTGLLERVKCQLRRLHVLEAILKEADGTPDGLDVTWTEFREMDEDALCSLASMLAARQSISALEALFIQEEHFIASHWQTVLDALPETAEISAVKNLLPSSKGGAALKVANAADWYMERALNIVDLTGLCRIAMELLEFAICSEQGLEWPERSASMPRTEELPLLQKKSQTLPRLYGMFCLCEEYQLYLQASHQEMVDSGWPLEEPPPVQSLVRFLDFCELPAPQRARLLLKRSRASTVVEDIHRWMLISVDLDTMEIPGESVAARLSRASLSGPKTEETLTKALLGRLGSHGWDPEQFRILAQVVQASSPALPRSERIIKDHTVLMQFIFKSVYSEDQRCHAADIFESVDAMYGCIPKADSDATADVEMWADFQKQADELEKHLTCVELLLKHKLKLSLSFADLRSGCSNENMAIHSMWNLFRVLGTHYRPALFWRGFQQELFYLHTHAFAAVSMNSVYDMYVRCLVDQDHVEVLNGVIENWMLCCGDVALGSLVVLAQELVNCSPSLRHATLEKATRLLKCVQSPQASEELDFIKACELLHDLLWRKPKRTLRWVQSAVQDITSGQALVNLSHEMRNNLNNLSKIGGKAQREQREVSAPATFSSIEGFCIETPVQLRLRIGQPLRIVTDLLEFNPPILLESEDLQKFCSLIGLSTSSPSWAEVMALCGAANLLCGDRVEALSVTEKLLVNKHPGAWKLAVALATDDGVDQTSGSLLADAARVCSDKDLPKLLSYLEAAPPAENQELMFSLDFSLDEETASGSFGEKGGNSEEAWQPDWTAGAGASPSGNVAEAIRAVNLLDENADSEAWDRCADLIDGLSGECPETEPDRIAGQSSASSALRALCEVCPDLDSGSIEELVQQILHKASTSPSESLALARSVAGVPELVNLGVTSSTVALHAAKTAATSESDTASLLFWLDPSDSLQLLEFVLDHCERQRTLEVIALLRFKTNDDPDLLMLGVALRQAEALTLLRSTGKTEMPPLRIHPELSMEEVKGRWLRQLEHLPDFLPLAETLLETGFS